MNGGVLHLLEIGKQGWTKYIMIVTWSTSADPIDGQYINIRPLCENIEAVWRTVSRVRRVRQAKPDYEDCSRQNLVCNAVGNS